MPTGDVAVYTRWASAVVAVHGAIAASSDMTEVPSIAASIAAAFAVRPLGICVSRMVGSRLVLVFAFDLRHGCSYSRALHA